MEKNGKVGWFSVLVFLFWLLGMSAPAAFAEEEGGGNWFSGLSKGLSNLTSRLPNVFSELTPEDAGTRPRIRPHFSTSTGYFSDADLSNDQSDRAWNLRVAPGVSLDLPMGDKLYGEVDYTYGFSTVQGRKVTSNTSTHNINGLVRYDLTDKTVVGLSNNLQFSEVPDRLGKTFTLETAQADLSHRITDKITGRGWYTFQYYDDPSPSSTTSREQDFRDSTFGGSMGYAVTEKLSVTPQVTWDVKEYRRVREKDYKQVQPLIGASYTLGPKTVLNANFGVAYRDFDKGSNESELVYGGGVTHSLGQKLVFNVSYQKSLQDTFNTSFVNNVDNPDATNLDVFDANFRTIKSHRVSSTANYNFNERSSVGAFVGAQFSGGDASDNVLGLGTNDEKILEAGSRYTFRLTRYLNFDIGYTFGRRFTAHNSPGRNEYTFHKVTGGINISF